MFKLSPDAPSACGGEFHYDGFNYYILRKSEGTSIAIILQWGKAPKFIE
jgi:hypothetical protein